MKCWILHLFRLFVAFAILLISNYIELIWNCSHFSCSTQLIKNIHFFCLETNKKHGSLLFSFANNLIKHRKTTELFTWAIHTLKSQFASFVYVFLGAIMLTKYIGRTVWIMDFSVGKSFSQISIKSQSHQLLGTWITLLRFTRGERQRHWFIYWIRNTVSISKSHAVSTLEFLVMHLRNVYTSNFGPYSVGYMEFPFIKSVM